MCVRIKGFLTNLLKDQNKNHPYDREKTCDSLFQIFLSVYDCGDKDRYLTDDQAKSFGITVEEMTLDDKSGEYTMRAGEEFFKPLSREALEACPVDESDEETKRLFKHFHDWPKQVKYMEERRVPVSRDLGGMLVQLAHANRRVGAGENATRTKLMKMKQWRSRGLCPDIINEYYTGMLTFGDAVNQYCRIDESYFSIYQREKEPHVMIMLQHFYEGNEDISRAEVLTTLAAMVTQMEHDYLESHCITPVLVISSMDSFQGRIIQAHVTNNGVLIQKTKLHAFRTQEEFDKSMSLFVRYMASDRVGDTHQQVLLDLPQKESVDVKQVSKIMENLSTTSPTDRKGGKVPMKFAEDQLSGDSISHTIEANTE